MKAVGWVGMLSGTGDSRHRAGRPGAQIDFLHRFLQAKIIFAATQDGVSF
jgi:hypothetical protein